MGCLGCVVAVMIVGLILVSWLLLLVAVVVFVALLICTHRVTHLRHLL